MERLREGSGGADRTATPAVVLSQAALTVCMEIFLKAPFPPCPRRRRRSPPPVARLFESLPRRRTRREHRGPGATGALPPILVRPGSIQDRASGVVGAGSCGAPEDIGACRCPPEMVHRGFSCSAHGRPHGPRNCHSERAHTPSLALRGTWRASRGIQLRLLRGQPSAEEPRTLTHPWLGDKPGSADSRFLGRRQNTVRNAGIEAAPPSE